MQHTEIIFVKSFTHFFHSLKIASLKRIYSLTKKEFVLFVGCIFLIIFGIIGFFNSISNSFSVAVPTYGGNLTEGILGNPRFINPVLAVSDIDQDLTQIVYSGLVRKISDGSLESQIIPDLAESYSISEDGKIYTFTIKDTAVFHDRKPVTAYDVAFTIQTIQDTRLQSPEFNNWFGVTTEIIDAKTIAIILPRAFSGFLENATVGILPAHIWGNFSPEEFLASTYNNQPIGSGPYKLKNINRDKNGVPTNYIFTAFNRFTLQKPYIQKVTINIYPNEELLLSAYQKGDIALLGGIRPYALDISIKKNTLTTPLPRMFGLFLNPEKKNIFKDQQLVNLLKSTISSKSIIDSVFQGYAQEISHPFPELHQKNKDLLSPEEIKQRLETLGWKTNPETGIRVKNNTPLSFTIATADTAELKYTAQLIQQQLQVLGIQTEIEVFQLNDLENSVIKPRNFDALLFGQFIRNDADIYAFWHSSQTTDPGLNITRFSSRKLDTAIETLFETIDPEKRNDLLVTIQEETANAPIIWLYQPNFIYATRKNINGIYLQSLINRKDRFTNIYQWYLYTDTIWKIFNK